MSTKLTENTFAVDKTCPLCGTGFSYEKLLSKKVSAKEVDLSLRNIYGPDMEGQNPLFYSVVVCPGCLYASFETEFDVTTIDGRDFRKAKKAAEDVIRVFKLQGNDFRTVRDIRSGLTSYYLAEVWYATRENFGYRNFRLAFSLYRRVWLLDIARKLKVVEENFFKQDRQYALQTAETYFERSFLEDRPPDRFYYGPDYGYDFGPASLPYLVSYINFLLAADKESGAPFAIRSARFSKAKKFSDCANIMALKEGPEELKRKIEIHRTNLVEMKHSLESEEKAVSATSTDAPVETMEWDLPLADLYLQYGVAKGKDEVVVHEGDRSRDMYFVLEGSVNVVKTYRTKAGEDNRLIAVLSTGSFFGEMSLLDGAPRFATVVASAPTKLVRVNADDLQAVIKAYPSVALRIMSVLSTRLRNYDDFVQNRLLSLLSTEKLTSKDSTGKTSTSRTALSTELTGLLTEVDNK